MAGDKSDLPSLAVKRPLLVAVLNLLLILAGLAALPAVEVRELPDIDRPIVSVNATFPGAAPETMDSEVTSVLEDAVARVTGIDRINSSSEENNSRIRIEFSPETDLDTAANDVREAVSRATRDLPERVEQVTVVKADSDAEPIMQLAVSSRTHDESELTRIVENDIVPELLTAEGVASIDLFGARKREMRVAVDPLKLNRYNLAVSDVATALENASFDVPIGSFRSKDQVLVVRADANAATPDLLRNVALGPTTRVGDVAEVYFAPADAVNFVRLNGEPIIGLGVIRQAGSNTIQISDEVTAAIARLDRRFKDLEVSIISDDADFIRVSVHEVLTALAITIGVVMATILVFFRAWKPTLIPGTTIPVALVGVIAGMWLLGFSINLLTLLALVLATGLIVDDAIVVLENIQRLQNQGVRPRAAAVLGTRQVFFAVVATTAVLISVFVPISFLPSEAGRLFREFGFVLAFAIVLSGFVALSLVPAIAARLDLKAAARPAGRIDKVGSWFGARYERLLDGCLNRPWLVVGSALAVAAAAALAFGVIEQELTPDEDRGAIIVDATGPDGVGLDFMDSELNEIEAVLQPHIDDGVMTSVFSVVGRFDPNRIRITGTLADWSDRDRSQSEIARDLRQPLSQIPGSRVSARGVGSLNVGGGSDRIEVALTGSDYGDIYKSALALAEAIDTDSDTLSNADISYQPTQPQVAVRIDRKRAADLGVSLDDIALSLRTMVGGEEIADLNVDDEAIPILLRPDSSVVTTPADLDNIYVRSSGQGLIPLSSVTERVEQGVAAELDRTEQRRSIEVEADIAPGVALQTAVDEIERLRDKVVADDIDMLLQGEAETLQETSRDLALTYALAFVVVFLVLVAQFESLASPVVVILTVPFGLAAAVFVLIASGVSLNIYSQIGLVMLIGLIAKNAILIVEFADQLRSEGRSVREAAAEAAAIRFRPITMTSVATIVGAVPLVLASGAGAEARQAIGWVIFGGLGLSAVFSLFLTPVLYVLIARRSQPRRREQQQLEAELEEAHGAAALSSGKGG